MISPPTDEGETRSPPSTREGLTQRESFELAAMAILILLAIDTFGRPWSFRKLFGALDATPEVSSLIELLWWCACCLLFFWGVPALWLKKRGMSWIDMVGKPPGWKASLIYLGFYLTVLPLMLYFYHDPRFVAQYPFYRYGREFPLLGLIWELSYGCMFFSLEFFFRGFLIRQLCPRWGWGGLWFSIIPYVAIHYLKPLPEMMGSLPAGLVLGYASWRSGSIWGGLAVHLGVAFTMDGLQLFCNS